MPKIVLFFTNVCPHLGSRGGPNGRPFLALANFVGIANILARRGRIVVDLPRLPMWILAYLEVNLNTATAPPFRPRPATALPN
jgi:hypothetical protein